MSAIALIDYGAGNLRSVHNALVAAGAGNVVVTADPDVGVLGASRILGVARGTVQARLDRLIERLNSILQASSTLTTTVCSLVEVTSPWIPPMVITLSPFLTAEIIFSVSFCFLFCGRIMKK